jgi:hypothetical protein
VMKLTNAQTKEAKAAFKKAAIADIISADELVNALTVLEPKFADWDGAQTWVDEFDEIGCGELGLEDFIKLCAGKDVFNGQGPDGGNAPSPPRAASPKAEPVVDKPPPAELSAKDIESARDAFNEADEVEFPACAPPSTLSVPDGRTSRQ